MKNSNTTSIVFLFLAFINLGCATKMSVLEKDINTEGLSLHGNIIDITINDKRPDVTHKKIEIPFVSSPRSYDKVSPYLSPEIKKEIKEEIASYFKNSGEELTIRVDILQGYQEFSATSFHEKEYAEFNIHLQILDLNNNVKNECRSSGFVETKTLDATYKRMELVYKKAIDLSIFKCMEEIGKITNKQQNL